MKLDILAFGAHPDDVELGAGGTIAKEISLGKTVGIIDLTQGELGTRGSAEIRHQEATKAKELLGVVVRENLKFRDGFFVNDEAHQLAIIKRNIFCFEGTSPPLHILRCASSRTSFKGGDVTVCIHEKLFRQSQYRDYGVLTINYCH